MARPKGSATTPENESKGDRFKRLAEARTAKALAAIASLAGLVGPNYEYTNEQWEKIFGAMTAEMTKLAERVKNPKGAASGAFSLD